MTAAPMVEVPDNMHEKEVQLEDLGDDIVFVASTLEGR